jgi:hypothetical protein
MRSAQGAHAMTPGPVISYFNPHRKIPPEKREYEKPWRDSLKGAQRA